MQQKEILTADEVAAYTGHTKKYIYKLCSMRKIPHYNPEDGRKVYFRLSEIIEWCTARKVKTTNQILNNI